MRPAPSKTAIQQLLAQPDGPRKKFYLVISVGRLHGSQACEEAKQLSCRDIENRWFRAPSARRKK